jgi:hypothetical protein
MGSTKRLGELALFQFGTVVSSFLFLRRALKSVSHLPIFITEVIIA